ncbi:MAG: chemotaxis protein CheW [Bdellovibrionaceae bacterium]|nr:chemotaxis protein CheW [Pseudobdellovibrionaceae bacterium]
MSDAIRKAVPIENGGRYLCFTLGKDKFAIPLLQVKEVIADVETTNIPQAPPYFQGIMNLRGQVISVIDLRVKLKLGKPEKSPETTIVILDLSPLILGVVVDSVDSVVEYEGADISPAPDTDSLLKTDYILGVARSEKTLTLLLDLAKVLNVDDFKFMKMQSAKAS